MDKLFPETSATVLGWRSAGIEHGLRDAAGFEEREAQQHRVADARPQGGADVAAGADALHEYRINRDADHDEECLKTQRKERPQIVAAHLPPFPIHHRRHRNRRNGCDHVNLNHTPIYDDEDADAQHPRQDAHQRGLKPQPEQRADFHCHQRLLHVSKQRGSIQRGIADDDARCLTDDVLRNIENRHHDIPCVGDNQHCGEGLENPLEEKEGVKVMQAVSVNKHLYQFQTHDEGQDDARNRHNNVFRQAANHLEDAAVPCLRRCADDRRRLAHAGVDGIKQTRQVADDAADQQPFQLFRDFIPDEIQRTSLLRNPLPLSSGSG